MGCMDAGGFQAAAALEQYEVLLAALCDGGPAPERAARLQYQLRRVCTYCLELPTLSGATLGLLLAHHRLLAELARSGHVLSDSETARALQHLEQSVTALQRACRELFLAGHLH